MTYSDTIPQKDIPISFLFLSNCVIWDYMTHTVIQYMIWSIKEDSKVTAVHTPCALAIIKARYNNVYDHIEENVFDNTYQKSLSTDV